MPCNNHFWYHSQKWSLQGIADGFPCRRLYSLVVLLCQPFWCFPIRILVFFVDFDTFFWCKFWCCCTISGVKTPHETGYGFYDERNQSLEKSFLKFGVTLPSHHFSFLMPWKFLHSHVGLDSTPHPFLRHEIYCVTSIRRTKDILLDSTTSTTTTTIITITAITNTYQEYHHPTRNTTTTTLLLSLRLPGSNKKLFSFLTIFFVVRPLAVVRSTHVTRTKDRALIWSP